MDSLIGSVNRTELIDSKPIRMNRAPRESGLVRSKSSESSLIRKLLNGIDSLREVRTMPRRLMPVGQLVNVDFQVFSAAMGRSRGRVLDKHSSRRIVGGK